jgi:predicted MPP superfamily phosphohydrolase
MAVFQATPQPPVTRRRFLKACAGGALGLALYSGEIARHWIDVTYHVVGLPGLHHAFDGMRIVQLSDIHLDDFTEPFFLRHVVTVVNQLRPEAVFLTGDFVSEGFASRNYSVEAAWLCGAILRELDCKDRYAVMGNHDVGVGAQKVTAALRENGTTVLRNSFVPIERGGARFWLAGLDDPVIGEPDPEKTIPAAIRNVAHEPVVLLCHAPDYADTLLRLPSGQAASLMLSGHTHGGQVRLPVLGPIELPPMGRKYVEGLFRLGNMQLFVNRGIGTIGVPFRLNCPPEITVLTLRAA